MRKRIQSVLSNMYIGELIAQQAERYGNTYSNLDRRSAAPT
jgi:hypothetical protein